MQGCYTANAQGAYDWFVGGHVPHCAAIARWASTLRAFNTLVTWAGNMLLHSQMPGLERARSTVWTGSDCATGGGGACAQDMPGWQPGSNTSDHSAAARACQAPHALLPACAPGHPVSERHGHRSTAREIDAVSRPWCCTVQFVSPPNSGWPALTGCCVLALCKPAAQAHAGSMLHLLLDKPLDSAPPTERFVPHSC